jgi:rubrerythrin
MPTSDNLKEAFAGESQANRKYLAFAKKAEEEGYPQVARFKQMYPGFVAEAEKEGNKPAFYSFQNALVVEEIHHGLYSEALESVKSDSDLPETKIFVCQVCGNTVRGEVPDKCPVCGAVKEKFIEIA